MADSTVIDNQTSSLTPSLTLEDLAAFRVLDDSISLYNKLRNLDHDYRLLDVLFKVNNFAVNYNDKLLCFIGIKNGYQHIYMFLIPRRFVNTDMCMMAVKQNGNIIREIIEHFPELLTSEMCLEAVKQCPDSIQYMSRHGWPNIATPLLTKEICITATRYGSNIHFVPKKFKYYCCYELYV